MFRWRVLALACLAVLTSAAAHAEGDPTPPPASTIDGSDTRPHISAAAIATGEKAAVAENANEPVKSQEAPAKNADTKDADAKVQDTKAADSKAADATAPVAASPPPPPATTLTAKVDLGKQTMVVSEDGDVKYSWPISSGAQEFPTPRGSFRPQWLAKMWYSKKYDNAPMPNAVFINGGVAIHATQHVSSLGRPASHGCIRLAPRNAKTFYNLVQKHGLKSTRVSVYGTPKWRSPAVASRQQPQQARRRYVERDDGDSWFSSGRTYRQPYGYDQRYTQRRYRQYPSYSNYGQQAPRVYYRGPGGQRFVYVQRPQRRYYYNNSGYGW
jgi:lipoprotein-anchoring transpeptidase ErfK/SrfK